MKLHLKWFLSVMSLLLMCKEVAFAWPYHHWHGGVVVVEPGFVGDPFYPHTVYYANVPNTVYVNAEPKTVYVERPSKTVVYSSSSYIDTEPALNTLICQSIDRFSWLSQYLPDSSGLIKSLYGSVKSGFDTYRNTTYPAHNHGHSMDACPVPASIQEDVTYTGIPLSTDPQVEDDFIKGSLCKSISYLRGEINLFKDNVFTTAKNVLVENLSTLQLQLSAKYPGYSCP